MKRNWCGSYCNWITFPFEFFIAITSLLVIKRNKFGWLGLSTLMVFSIWMGMFLYDYFVFN
jgi:hypothetical protein